MKTINFQQMFVSGYIDTQRPLIYRPNYRAMKLQGVDRDKHDVKQITAKFSDRCSEVMQTLNQTGTARDFNIRAKKNVQKSGFATAGGFNELHEEPDDDVASQLSNLLKRKGTMITSAEDAKTSAKSKIRAMIKKYQRKRAYSPRKDQNFSAEELRAHL